MASNVSLDLSNMEEQERGINSLYNCCLSLCLPPFPNHHLWKTFFFWNVKEEGKGGADGGRDELYKGSDLWME